jgi:hypothetical protein
MVAFASVLLLNASFAYAQSGRERPLQEVFRTDLIYSQDRGEIQFTTGPNIMWSHGLRLVQSPTQAEYGLTDSWQLQFDWDGWQRLTQTGQPSVNGTGDLTVGTKYSFMNVRGSKFHAAIALDFTLPFGSVDRGLGDGLLAIQPSLMLARDIPNYHHVQIFTQSGVAFVHRMKHHLDSLDDEPAAHRFFLSGGFFLPLRHVVITSELSWQTDRWNHSGRDNQIYATSGLVWKFPGRWECGVGVSLGITPTSDPVGLQVKFTKEFQTRRSEDK